MTDIVLADRDADGVLTLTLNAPERRNGWDSDMQEAYYGELTAAAADPQVRAVVLTGAGRTFCPGADLSRLGRLAEPGAVLPHVAPDVPSRFPKPLIGAINGACAGVGLVQALYCHVRFAAEGARFATSFARRGLVAEYGIAWILTRLVGQENALDLLLTGRAFDAAEAKALGMVSRVVPADEVLGAAQAYARDIAVNCAPHSLAAIIEQVRADAESDYDTAVAHAFDRVDAFIGGPDLREGLQSFMEKRAPVFRPYPG